MAQAAPSPWADQVRVALEAQGRRPVIEYLQRQRWFRGKGKPVADVRLIDAFELSPGPAPQVLVVLLVEYRGGVQERYLALFSIRPRVGGDEAVAVAALSASSTQQWVCDATKEEDAWRALYGAVGEGKEIIGQSGCLTGRVISGKQQELTTSVDQVKALSVEQSNTSVLLDREAVMKLIRKVEIGINPESEVLEFLATQTTCRNVPSLLGVMTFHENEFEETDGEGTILLIQGFVPNKGDGWSYTLTRLEEFLGNARGTAPELVGHPSQAVSRLSGTFLDEIRHLGLLTGNLHLALASKTEPEAFRPEPITVYDVEQWQGKMTQFLVDVCRDLRSVPVEQQIMVGLSLEEVDWLETICRNRFGNLGLLSKGRSAKIRHHGDYHLGQVLKTEDGFVVIDFEGEPARPLEERRVKVCPLKDVAGMLRSFDYAVKVTLKKHPSISDRDVAIMAEWEVEARKAFLDGYRSSINSGETSFLPDSWEDMCRVVQVYELDKALYELRYEMHNRPDWLSIPLEGIRAILRRESSLGDGAVAG